MYTLMMIQKIAKAVYPKYSDEYDYIGIRIQEDTHGARIGATITHESSVWIDGDETSERINGVCAVSAKEALSFRGLRAECDGYSGDTVLILGGNYASDGEDDGEIILRNPVVLDIIA